MIQHDGESESTVHELHEHLDRLRERALLIDESREGKERALQLGHPSETLEGLLSVLNKLRRQIPADDESSTSAIEYIQKHVQDQHDILSGVQSKYRKAKPQQEITAEHDQSTRSTNTESDPQSKRDSESAAPLYDPQQQPHHGQQQADPLVREGSPSTAPNPGQSSGELLLAPSSSVIDEEAAGFLAASDLFLKDERTCDDLRQQVRIIAARLQACSLRS